MPSYFSDFRNIILQGPFETGLSYLLTPNMRKGGCDLQEEKKFHLSHYTLKLKQTTLLKLPQVQSLSTHECFQSDTILIMHFYWTCLSTLHLYAILEWNFAVHTKMLNKQWYATCIMKYQMMSVFSKASSLFFAVHASMMGFCFRCLHSGQCSQ